MYMYEENKEKVIIKKKSKIKIKIKKNHKGTERAAPQNVESRRRSEGSVCVNVHMNVWVDIVDVCVVVGGGVARTHRAVCHN